MSITNPPPAACTRQVLLGVFIVGQLFFLVSANLLGFLNDNRAALEPDVRQVAEALAPGWPDEKGHVWHLLDHLAKTDKMWAEATGQAQSWSLFAPTIGRECVFPALELHWDDDDAAPELVLSDNEPAEPDRYFRIGSYRLRRYESNLTITLRALEGETPEQTDERWSENIHNHVADYARIIQGYMRWRLGQIMARRAGSEQPRQVILVLRRYHINDYADAPPYWDGPHAVPLARWQPRVNWDADHEPLEWYDPATERFKSLSK